MNIAHVQQFSVRLRYVDEDISKIHKDFLTFTSVYSVIGKALCATIRYSTSPRIQSRKSSRSGIWWGAVSMRGHCREV